MLHPFLAKFRRGRSAALALLLFGCAGTSRSCASSVAESFGADWVIVTSGADGRIVNCWKLANVSVANELHTDGIYWQAGSGHFVHISGWYNRVQVAGGDFDAAAKQIGVDLARCPGGRYLDEARAATAVVDPAPQTRADESGGGRVVSATFEGGHKVRAVLGAGGRAQELRVDGKPVARDSATGRAALRAAGVLQ
jgi:hypothetical protein